MKLIIFLIFLFQVSEIKCAKILAILPFPGRSHYIIASALMRELAERGHEVTVVSCFGEKDLPQNVSYRDVILTDFLKQMEERKDVDMFERAGSNPFVDAVFLIHLTTKIPHFILQDSNMKALIESGETFDVLILEQFYNDGFKTLAPHFKAHLVLISMVRANFWINSLMGNPGPTSYIPDIFINYSPHMNFWQRFVNTALVSFQYLLHTFYFYPKHNEAVHQYYPDLPDLYDVLYNASIVLVNSHPSISQPVPLTPNMIEVGGMHIKPPKALPEDLQKFLDESDEGVIYFSLGSNLKSVFLPPEKRQIFLDVFSKLNHKILWKWENDTLPNQPPNVVVRKWLPQRDILAHPNIKLFISHGGFTSTTETVYHGVPVLVIPVYGDQKLNGQMLTDNGVGLMLPFTEVTEEKLAKNIDEVLNNPKYRNGAKKMSSLFHDRVSSPMDTAVYWIEYVIRHGGAGHLRVAGADLPWYKYYLLDVIGVVVLSILISIFIVIKTVKLVLRRRTIKKKEKVQ